ncbi:hypothetical protein GMES_3645 [Paraglaciecola mesophila KMM 241]|uniref:Uncharacterized protein n=1 Tax=Paraglaciecola mesophila KMM 241 TaxID=1128912 RepID=K6Z6C1_9ALTE|nr:hypothetical protein GMES_3645 [Paraglaciecola mesophila KMM 241]
MRKRKSKFHNFNIRSTKALIGFVENTSGIRAQQLAQLASLTKNNKSH